MGIPGTHDSTLVALSVLIAAAASYTALDLAGRIRACSGWSCHAWLATAAVAMGGGIWSMHFVAMLAFSMPGMEVNYDLGLTAVSLWHRFSSPVPLSMWSTGKTPEPSRLLLAVSLWALAS